MPINPPAPPPKPQERAVAVIRTQRLNLMGVALAVTLGVAVFAANGSVIVGLLAGYSVGLGWLVRSLVR